MAGSPINFTHQLGDSGTAAGSQVETNFQDVNDFLNGTKVGLAQLQNPRADVMVEFEHIGALAAGATVYKVLRIPAGVTWRAVAGQVSMWSKSGAVTVTFNCHVWAASAWTSIFSTAPNTAVDSSTTPTVDERTAFTASPYDIVAGTLVRLSLGAAGGTSATDVSGRLWGSTLHRS